MSLITTLKHLEATSKIVADGERELVDSMSNGRLKAFVCSVRIIPLVWVTGKKVLALARVGHFRI
jgi:hypothetical protein